MHNLFRKMFFLSLVLAALLIGGCEGGGDEVNTGRGLFGGNAKIVGKQIAFDDISEFYYTVEDINYDAFYQRYMFYVSNGRYYFFHETRERKNDYGPATEEDATAKGTMELDDDRWEKFCDLIEGGSVKARSDNAESGDRGPWYFLYWKGDKDKYQVYKFASAAEESGFEKYCEELAKEAGNELDGAAGGLSEEDLSIELMSIDYHPGYGDMNGESHYNSLMKDASGQWIIESSDCEDHSSPMVITDYGLTEEDITGLELFIQSAEFDTMQNRPDSDLFITDYSSWSFTINYKDLNTGDVISVRLEEYKEYTDEDYALIKEFFKRFNGLKNNVISQYEEQ